MAVETYYGDKEFRYATTKSAKDHSKAMGQCKVAKTINPVADKPNHSLGTPSGEEWIKWTAPGWASFAYDDIKQGTNLEKNYALLWDIVRETDDRCDLAQEILTWWSKYDPYNYSRLSREKAARPVSIWGKLTPKWAR